jgi:acetyltransferase-like isoleucine patch superfamily enzyme
MIFKIFVFAAKKFKGEDFKIDSNFSSFDLIKKLIVIFCKQVRGFWYFPLIISKKILIGKRVSLKSKRKIIFLGSNYNFDNDVFIDATSQKGILLGNNVSIQKRVIIECTGSLTKMGLGLVLGDNVGIGSNSFLGCAGGITIGNDTILGNFVSMHSENHNYSNRKIPIRLQGVNSKGIKIGADCWIGAKVTILDGVNLGDGCIVAAGAVLTEGSYPPFSILGGVPAKIIKER